MSNRKRPGAGSWLLAVLFHFLLASQVVAAETVVMRVYLNQQDKGDRFFKWEGNTPLFKPSELRSMGLEQLPDVEMRQIDGVGYLDLALLQPELSWRVDSEQSAIHIDAAPRYFGKQSHSQSFFNIPEGLVYRNEMSAYANYGIEISGHDGAESVTLSAPLETVFHAGSFTAYSNFLYTSSEDSSQFVRLMSAVTRDGRESLTRLTLGDFAATTGMDGGGGLYGGVSITRNYSIDPYFNRFIAFSVDGEAYTQSLVEYYLDDRLQFSQQVSPGPFEFRDMRPTAGAHRSHMVIRDVFGNEDVVYGNFYFASRLLKPGVHEFSYNAGFERENFGRRNADYGDPVALGFHRAGITDWLTVGGRGEFSRDVSNLGASASILFSHFGEMEVSLSGSNSDSGNGYAASVDYRYNTQFLSVNTGFRTLSRDYSNLSLEPGDDKTEYEWRAGMALNVPNIGSWSAYYSARKLYSGFRANRSTLYFSKRIGRFASLVARYTRLSGSYEDQEFFLSIGRPLGRGHTGFIDYQNSKNSSQLSARLSKYRPLGEGFGYAVRAGLLDDHANVDLFAEYAGPVGLYSAGYRRVNGRNQYRAQVSGSVSWIDNGIRLSRPIADGFAVVKVGDLRDVGVRFNNQFMGKSDKHGELVIPTLQSYLGNRISIDDTNIPINYEFAGFNKVVTTPFRAGAVINFNGTRLQAITGRLFVDSSEGPQPAEYWGLRYALDGQLKESLVGKAGEFYLENLAPGDHQVELYSGNRSCRFILNIPESEDMYIDLGKITCDDFD